MASARSSGGTASAGRPWRAMVWPRLASVSARAGSSAGRRFLAGGQDLAVEPLRLLGAAAGVGEGRHVALRLGNGGVLGAERLPADVERLLLEAALGLLEAAELLGQQHAQIVQALRRLGCRAERRLPDGERAPRQRLRLRRPTERPQRLGLVAQALRHARVVGPERRLPQGERLLVERQGVLRPARGVEDKTQIVGRRRPPRVGLAHLFRDVVGLPQAHLGRRIVALVRLGDPGVAQLLPALEIHLGRGRLADEAKDNRERERGHRTGRNLPIPHLPPVGAARPPRWSPPT